MDQELYTLRTMLSKHVSNNLSAIESLSKLLRQYSELYNVFVEQSLYEVEAGDLPEAAYTVLVDQYYLPCCDVK